MNLTQPSARRMLVGHVAMRVAAIALQSMLVLVTGWICTPTAFGDFVVILAHCALGATVCAGGAQQGALRVAHLLAPDSRWQGPMVRALTMSAARRSFAGTTIAAALLAVNPASSWASVAASVPLTAAMTLASAATGFTVARGRAPIAQAADLAVRLPLQAAALGVLVWTDTASGPALASATALGSFAYGAALLALLPWRAGAPRPLPAAMRPLLDRFITTASLNAVLFTLLSSMDVMLGSRLVSVETIAPLGIALRISGALAMLHGSIFEYHAAGLARSMRISGNEDATRLYSTVAAESTGLTIVAMLALLGGLAFAPVDLPPSYAASIAPLWILLVARLVSGGIGPAPALMTIAGRHAPLAAATTAGIAAETMAIFLLAKPLGATGLAVGSGVGLCTYCIITRVLLSRSMKPRDIGR